MTHESLTDAERLEASKAWHAFIQRESSPFTKLYLTYFAIVYPLFGCKEDFLASSEEQKKLLMHAFVDSMNAEQARTILKMTLDQLLGMPMVMLDLYSFTQEQRSDSRRSNAKRSAKAKLATDPKQRAKAVAKVMWEDWQSGRVHHKSGAAFARHVVDKVEALDSTTVVERWAREWRKEKRTLLAE